MTSILLISSNASIKSLKAKDITFDTLYKKCGFKSADDFDRRTSWNVTIEGEEVIIELWTKNDGKANTENKYDFPPPVDNDLFFGTCALVRLDKKTGNIINLAEETWTKVYEKLFGGFEDIGDEDEYSEDELENVSKELKTKKGYLKDGFVVEDDEDPEDGEEYEDDDEEDENEFEEENEEDEIDPIKMAAVEEDENNDDGSELEEEEYIYSDDE